MSTDITYAEPRGAQWERPLTELGDGEIVPAGKYAITLPTGSGGVVILGTAEEFATFGNSVRHIIASIAEHAARPLTHSDFNYDAADNGYTCPRCEAFLEPAMYSGLVGLIQAIDAHIAGHRAEHERGE